MHGYCRVIDQMLKTRPEDMNHPRVDSLSVTWSFLMSCSRCPAVTTAFFRPPIVHPPAFRPSSDAHDARSFEASFICIYGPVFEAQGFLAELRVP